MVIGSGREKIPMKVIGGRFRAFEYFREWLKEKGIPLGFDT
jgi:hypothetical protein